MTKIHEFKNDTHERQKYYSNNYEQFGIEAKYGYKKIDKKIIR